VLTPAPVHAAPSRAAWVNVAGYVRAAGGQVLTDAGAYWIVTRDRAWLLYPPAESPVTIDDPGSVKLVHEQLYATRALLTTLLPPPASEGAAAPGSGPAGEAGRGGSAAAKGPVATATVPAHHQAADGGGPASGHAVPPPGAALVAATAAVAAAGGQVLSGNGQWWVLAGGHAWLLYPPSQSPVTIDQPETVAVRGGQLYISRALLAQLLPASGPGAATVAAAVYTAAPPAATPFGRVPSALLTVPPPPPESVAPASGFLQRVLAAVARWDPLVRLVATPAVPAALIRAVMAQESGGQRAVVSAAGAVGLMQIMPSLGVATSQLVNPAVNLWVGSRLLNQLARRYGLTAACWSGGGLLRSCRPRLDLVLAAYNAGPAAAPAWRQIPEVVRYVRDVEAVLAAE
jgi:soluble lytic murein transglycosylase-like protein